MPFLTVSLVLAGLVGPFFTDQFFSGQAFANDPVSFDKDAALATVKTLAADEMNGRAAGTEGGALARAFLLREITEHGYDPVGPTYEHSFRFTPRRRNGEELPEVIGTNILFQMDGTGNTGQTIVVSAHYDHLGVRDGQIYNGADDNASGVAGVLAVAEHFKANPPSNDVIFALFDAEEMGLQGARAFVRNVDLIDPNIAFNINFDMLSRSDKNELYVAGVFHRPTLKPIVEDIVGKVPVSLKMGHDDPALGSGDWTFASDQGPFHRAGIPFLYFGVEDHPHYHRPSDDWDTVSTDFFLRSLETVVIAAADIDLWMAQKSD